MALFKKLGKAVKKAVGGGAVASSQRMAPAMRGAVASMPDRMPQQSPDRMPQPNMGGIVRGVENNYRGIAGLANPVARMPEARMPEASFPETKTNSGRTLARMPETGLPETKTNSGRLSSVIKRQPAVVNSSTPRKSSSVMGKMAGAVATASKKMQPALGGAATAAAKPAVGAPLQKKSIGKVLRKGLIGRR